MTIRNMTIILNILKYDNLQYDNYFEKIVIFEFENMTKKKTYALCPEPPVFQKGVKTLPLAKENNTA